jgi:hypothetical protein
MLGVVVDGLRCGMRWSGARFLLGLLTSLAVTVAGLWITTATPDAEFQSFGWLLVAVGLVCLAANLALRRYAR